MRRLLGSNHGCVYLVTVDEVEPPPPFYPEDWPGEAALVEAEMRRFQKWAERKVTLLVGCFDGYVGRWLNGAREDWGLFVADREHVAIRLAVAHEYPGTRQVWP